METGMVYLVGAGPGDPGLITVKGMEKLARADVVVYDRLAGDALLHKVKPGAILIDAGKQPDHHRLKQEEINRLLYQKAKDGRMVVRLKGGDPFVFGRGGEEAAYLAERGIPFEVIPGVSSAVAVPAYAGIPVTHRAYNSSLAIVTGSEVDGKEHESIDWDKLTSCAGTLVFLMGMKSLGTICRRLVEHGRSPMTPAALIRWGTLPRQQTLVGTLADIEGKAKEEGFANPSVIVVGEVVALREKLNWFETRPLFGRRIIVTRAREDAGTLVSLLAAYGGEAIEFPTIVAAPAPDYGDLDRCLFKLSSYHWLVFTSANGVKFFMNRLLSSGRDVRDLKGLKLAAIGPKTGALLEQFGLKVDLVPEEFRAEAILENLKGKVRPGERILLPRAAFARDVLVNGLLQLGLEVDEVCAYQTLPVAENREALLEMLKKGQIDAVTFTSSSTVRNFVQAIGPEVLPEIRERVAVASIGPVTAETAARYGLDSRVTASSYTIEGLVEALVKYFSKPGERK